jgi:hypothetical protein
MPGKRRKTTKPYYEGHSGLNAGADDLSAGLKRGLSFIRHDTGLSGSTYSKKLNLSDQALGSFDPMYFQWVGVRQTEHLCEHLSVIGICKAERRG